VAKGIIGRERNSWKAAKKIAKWVKAEISSNYDVGFATAKEVLKNREGDCSEHTVITVGLCRAAGIPARAAVGIMYAHGIFAYHMWSEVYVGRWINLDAKWLAVDKKTGEYYTDATHIKFGRSLLDEDIFKEMAQAISEIVGHLKVKILDH
jgi:transglutaminase-like putative cysteine protease